MLDRDDHSRRGRGWPGGLHDRVRVRGVGRRREKVEPRHELAADVRERARPGDVDQKAQSHAVLGRVARARTRQQGGRDLAEADLSIRGNRIQGKDVNPAGQVDSTAANEVEVLQIDHVDQAAADAAEAFGGKADMLECADLGVTVAAADLGDNPGLLVGPREFEVEHALGVNIRPLQGSRAIKRNGDMGSLP